MNNRTPRLLEIGCSVLGGLVAASCSGGGSSAIHGSPTGAGGGAGPGGGRDSSALVDDAGGAGGIVTAGPDGGVPADDSSAPGSSMPDATTAGAGSLDAAADSDIPGWTLTWSDEFNGPDGTAVDPTKWKHDVGGTGWGNNELEYYTDGTQNAVVEGGNLVVTATTQG